MPEERYGRGMPAAPDAIISALTPWALHIPLCLILERETGRLWRWWMKRRMRKAGRNRGVNRS